MIKDTNFTKLLERLTERFLNSAVFSPLPVLVVLSVL